MNSHWKVPLGYFLIDSLNEELIILDPCYMLKLVRNSFEKVEYFETKHGPAKWKFVQQLQTYNDCDACEFPHKLHKSYRKVFQCSSVPKRKKNALGFFINLKNVLNLYSTLHGRSFRYPSTHKLDHLETFFSAVRSRLGTNNNPSAYQFKYT